MASSSSGSPIPAPEAVQVLVSSLADESPMVREASMASLKDIAALNPLLVLDCCSAVSRGGRRRFGNMAGVFQVMACGVQALDKKDVDPAFMSKLAKIATAEMISSKELNADWQRAASALLVSIGSHFPDLMMEEIFLHLSGPNSALPAMVQILADFAPADEKATMGEKEWYFFSLRDQKYPTGFRTNKAAEDGYWERQRDLQLQ